MAKAIEITDSNFEEIITPSQDVTLSLEKQEKDLINRNFSSDLIERQKNIITRLLESEKALMERGFEEKRESKSGNNTTNGNQIRFDEYNKTKLKEIELLKSADPSLRLYYKERANQYFNLN